MMNKLSGAFLWILVFQIIGYFIGKMTGDNISTWYQTLEKSILSPPDIVFSIVWVILYVMLALVGWALWLKRNQESGRLVLSLYGVQMLMNWSWSFIFFSLHFIVVGLYWIIAMTMITLIIILICWKNNKPISILLLPYWFWLLFASYLNWAIWMKN